MTAWKWLAVGVLSSTALAQDAVPGKKAESRVSAVTVYQEE